MNLNRREFKPVREELNTTYSSTSKRRNGVEAILDKELQ